MSGDEHISAFGRPFIKWLNQSSQEFSCSSFLVSMSTLQIPLLLPCVYGSDWFARGFFLIALLSLALGILFMICLRKVSLHGLASSQKNALIT